MPGDSEHKGTTESSGRRTRRRLRGMLKTKTGKTIGLASIAAPVIGYIVQDLRKPDSLIRELVGGTVNKLIAYRRKKTEAIDISDKVEILEEK